MWRISFKLHLGTDVMNYETYSIIVREPHARINPPSKEVIRGLVRDHMQMTNQRHASIGRQKTLILSRRAILMIEWKSDSGT
jgi:hypothetical protein